MTTRSLESLIFTVLKAPEYHAQSCPHSKELLANLRFEEKPLPLFSRRAALGTQFYCFVDHNSIQDAWGMRSWASRLSSMSQAAQNPCNGFCVPSVMLALGIRRTSIVCQALHTHNDKLHLQQGSMHSEKKSPISTPSQKYNLQNPRKLLWNGNPVALLLTTQFKN